MATGAASAAPKSQISAIISKLLTACPQPQPTSRNSLGGPASPPSEGTAAPTHPQPHPQTLAQHLHGEPLEVAGSYEDQHQVEAHGSMTNGQHPHRSSSSAHVDVASAHIDVGGHVQLDPHLCAQDMGMFLTADSIALPSSHGQGSPDQLTELALARVEQPVEYEQPMEGEDSGGNANGAGQASSASEAGVRAASMSTLRDKIAKLGYVMNDNHWQLKIGREGGKFRVQALYWHGQSYRNATPALRAFELVMSCITNLRQPGALSDPTINQPPQEAPVPVGVFRTGKQLSAALWVNPQEVLLDSKIQPNFVLCDPYSLQPRQPVQAMTCTALVAKAGMNVKGGRRDVQLQAPLKWMYGMVYEAGSTLAWVLSTAYAAHKQFNISLPAIAWRKTQATAAAETRQLIPCDVPVSLPEMLPPPEGMRMSSNNGHGNGRPQQFEQPIAKRQRFCSAAETAAILMASQNLMMQTGGQGFNPFTAFQNASAQHSMQPVTGRVELSMDEANRMTAPMGYDESDAAAAGLLMLVQPGSDAQAEVMIPGGQGVPLQSPPPQQPVAQQEHPMSAPQPRTGPAGLQAALKAALMPVKTQPPSPASAPRPLALPAPSSNNSLVLANSGGPPRLPAPQYDNEGALTQLSELQAMDGIVRLLRHMGYGGTVKQLWQRYNAEWKISNEGRFTFAMHYLQLHSAYMDDQDMDYVRQVLLEQFNLTL